MNDHQAERRQVMKGIKNDAYYKYLLCAKKYAKTQLDDAKCKCQEIECRASLLTIQAAICEYEIYYKGIGDE